MSRAKKESRFQEPDTQSEINFLLLLDLTDVCVFAVPGTDYPKYTEMACEFKHTIYVAVLLFEKLRTMGD